MRTLLVEDDEAVRDGIELALRLDGYSVETAADGDQALGRLAETGQDLVILDLMLPGTDGLAVCRELRERGQTLPVLMLTARDSVDDRILGLDAGADDYLVKPFALGELKARIRALLRRAPSSGADVLHYDDLVLDRKAFSVHRGGRRIETTRTEFLILELFLMHPRQVLTRDVLLDRVWGESRPTGSLEVFIGLLRRKTEAAGERCVLHTVRGFGYVLR
jgi:two-component system response regulator MprA